MKNSFLTLLANVIFSFKWLLVPFYIGLYSIVLFYMGESYHTILHIYNDHVAGEELQRLSFELIDHTLICALAVMCAQGGYKIFIDSKANDRVKNPPAWLNHFDTTSMKVKIGMSLVGVSSVDILSVLKDIDHYEWKAILGKVLIHIILCLTTFWLAKTGVEMHRTANH